MESIFQTSIFSFFFHFVLKLFRSKKYPKLQAEICYAWSFPSYDTNISHLAKNNPRNLLLTQTFPFLMFQIFSFYFFRGNEKKTHMRYEHIYIWLWVSAISFVKIGPLIFVLPLRPLSHPRLSHFHSHKESTILFIYTLNVNVLFIKN